MLPCPAWTLFEGSAPLNGATQLPEGFNAPDLGPKTYIAYGMQEEVRSSFGKLACAVMTSDKKKASA